MAMKTPTQKPENLLKRGALELGIKLSPQQCAQFLIYLRLLKRWNRRVNLTSISGDKAIIEKHFLDSMMGASVLEGSTQPKVLDIGSGAGFPGVPLKIICPEIDLVLLDSSQKKAAFLHQVLGELELKGVRVFVERMEVFSREPAHQRGFDFIVSRAYAKPSKVFAQAVPMVSSGGRILLYTGPSGDRELELPESWRIKKTEYRLPFSKTLHALLVFWR